MFHQPSVILLYMFLSVIPPLVSALAQKYGLSYNKIFIKDISSRFGSCSAKKNLNFSLALSAFCEEFISFIVLHELAHTVHLNHSDKFYLLLSRICPEHKRISKEYSKVYSNVLKAICSWFSRQVAFISVRPLSCSNTALPPPPTYFRRTHRR